MADREACDECKLKCSLIHGKKTDPSPLVTTFIKILFGRYDLSQELCLPPKISQAIPGLVAGENYILQDSIGQRWEVKLGTKDDVLAFREGWTKFYEDHGLRVGYVLTFHYIRNSYFVVQICDTTGFEKLKFPVATGKKRKRSEIEGNCNTVGECPNISDHSTKKQGAAFSDAYQHVASANCDTEQIYMINRDDGYNYEDRSPLLNLANSELQFRIDPDGGSDNRPRPSITSVESDAVAGNLNENTVSAKIVRSEPPAKVISPTLSNNITSKRVNVAEVDKDNHGDHPYVPPIENQGPSLNLFNLELQFRVDPDGGRDSRPHPSNTLAESDAVSGNLNENTVSTKVVSREPPAEMAAPILFNNITSKRANVAEVDSDHPYVPPIEDQVQVPSECRIKSPTTSSKRFTEKAAGRKKRSDSDAVAGDLNENTVFAKVVSREPPAEAAAATLSNNITSKRANVAEVDNEVAEVDNDHQAQVPSECRIKSPTMSSKRVNEKATGRKKHSEKHPKSSNRSAQTSGGVERNNGVRIRRVVRTKPVRGVERNNEVRVRRVVRTKPVDVFNAGSVDASAFSFTAIVESHEILEFPASVKFWESVEKKVVNLQGPNEEVWPVLYQNELGIKALTSGWEHFYNSCRLQKGDKCGFILEDEATSTFRVDVT